MTAILDGKTVASSPPTLPAVQPDSTVHLPTQEEVVAAIMAEAGCSEQRAAGLDKYLGRVAEECLRTGGWHRVPNRELRTYHRIMDTIMPDDVVEAPIGSAHALLNLRHLPSPMGFVHGKTRVEREDRCGMMVVDAFKLV